MFANAKRAVRIDAPGKLDPKLILFPNLAGPRLLDRLTESDPGGRLSLITVQIVAFRTQSHGQDIIGKPGRLVPNRCESAVNTDFRFVFQNLHTAHAVRICPDGVVDACEVDIKNVSSFPEKMRKKEAHLEEGQGKLGGPGQLIPVFRVRRHSHRSGDELIPGIRGGTTWSGNGPAEHVQKEEAAGRLPPAKISRT